MKIIVALTLAVTVSSAAHAVPPKHAAHHVKTAQDAQVDAAVTSVRNLEAQTADSQAEAAALLRGDHVAAAAAESRMRERDCKDHDLYMHDFERASPDDREVMHERCYGSAPR